MRARRSRVASGVDTLGLLLSVAVHPASIQDRDGIALVLSRLFPFIEHIFADGGYQGPKAARAAARTGKWTIEVVERSAIIGFEVLPKRWIVIVCTMLPSWALSGPRSSSAGVASGDRRSLRYVAIRKRVNLPQATQIHRRI